MCVTIAPLAGAIFCWRFMRALIFVNGEFDNPEAAQRLVRPDDLIIAADGGTEYALSVGAMPYVVIGDLDSITSQDLERVTSAGGEIVRFPTQKDETDLELALKYAVRAGATEIVILAALGGRLDQTLANLFLMASPVLAGINVRVVEANQEAFLIRAGQEVIVQGEPGDTLSLIPLGSDAEGVTAHGVAWSLDDDTLRFGLARGVSNELTENRARISLRRGCLLCVLIRR